jgi:collagen beta-1,O-galactosyltransferase
VFSISAVDGPPLAVNKLLSGFVKHPYEDQLPVDKVYMISLVRRPERRTRMLQSFQELAISATTVDAVDGQ